MRKVVGYLLLVLLIANFTNIGAGAPSLSNSGGGSWQYYREITISGSSLSDYQVLVQLSGFNFPTNARSDGGDIRFTDANGNELSYWSESWDHSGQIALIWVKVPSIPATIRMYYGNDKASSSSNGDLVFMFFDDFDSSSINTAKWQIVGSHEMIVGNSLLYIGVGNVASPPALSSKNYFNDNVIIEMKVKSRNDADPGIFARANLIPNAWNSPGYSFIEDPDETAWSKDVPHIGIEGKDTYYALIKDPTFDASPDLFWWYSAFLDGSKLGFRIYDTSRNKKVDISVVDTNYSTGTALGIKKDPREWEHSSAWVDTFIIRKYTFSEPTINLGSEQSTTGSISVTSSPSGAEVLIDGISKGTAPITVSNIAPGSHAMKCRFSGYLDNETTVNVVAGGAATVTCTLSSIPTASPTPSPTPTASPTPSPTPTSIPIPAPIRTSITPAIEPSLSVSPESFSFDCGAMKAGESMSHLFSISNAGGGTLIWSASDDQPWISMNPTSGTNSGTVTINIDTSGLGPGSHSGTITVSSNGGTKKGRIALQIPPTTTPIPTPSPPMPLLQIMGVILVLAGLLLSYLTTLKGDTVIEFGIAEKHLKYVGGIGLLLVITGAYILLKSQGLI